MFIFSLKRMTLLWVNLQIHYTSIIQYSNGKKKDNVVSRELDFGIQRCVFAIKCNHGNHSNTAVCNVTQYQINIKSIPS